MESVKEKLGRKIGKGRSIIPYVSLSKKAQAILFNKKAIELMKLERGQIIAFYEDDDDIMIQKTEEISKGNRLSSWGNKGKTLGFKDRVLTEELFDLTNSTGEDLIRLRVDVTTERDLYILSKIE